MDIIRCSSGGIDSWLYHLYPWYKEIIIKEAYVSREEVDALLELFSNLADYEEHLDIVSEELFGVEHIYELGWGEVVVSCLPLNKTLKIGFLPPNWPGSAQETITPTVEEILTRIDKIYREAELVETIREMNPTACRLVIETQGDGIAIPDPHSTQHTKGSVVSVAAIPSSDWAFSHWLLNGTNVGSANPYNLTMDANYNLIAVFVRYFKLVIETQGDGITIPEPGTHKHPEGSIVCVTAIPSSGLVFSHWLLNGTNVGSANPYNLTMNANYNLTAVYIIPSDYTKAPESPTWALIIFVPIIIIIVLIAYRRIR